MSDELKTQAKELTRLLRHRAKETGLKMDAAGYAAIADVKRILKLSDALFKQIVDKNEKARLQVNGDRIRAVQGHSPKDTPVTADALEATWTVHKGTQNLWFFTNLDAVPAIAKNGVLPREQRTHVKLTAGRTSKSPTRPTTAVMLEVSPGALAKAGVKIFELPHRVLLVRKVPAAAIVGLRARSQVAKAKEKALRALFNLR